MAERRSLFPSLAPFDISSFYFLLITLFMLIAQTICDSKAPSTLLMGDSLSAVLDCTFKGKSGLCVPSVLKDMVCVPLGFQFDADPKTCGADNVCCHSVVDGDGPKTATTSTPDTTKSTVQATTEPPKASASLVVLSSDQKPQTTAFDKAAKPEPFKIPASLSAYIPGYQPPASKTTKRQKIQQVSLAPGFDPSKTPVKFCHVGNTQGMCVKADLVQTLCVPLGFTAKKSDCSGENVCCYSGDKGDNKSPSVSQGSISVTNGNGNVFKSITKKTPAMTDSVSQMDTCSPSPGLAGLCIRADIAPMVCTPLGYLTTGQLTCASDRICCYSDKAADYTSAAVTISSTLPQDQTFQLTDGTPSATARTCNLGPTIDGICVPANLVSSCPLFGRKISAFGCVKRHLAVPEYCCYTEVTDNDQDQPKAVIRGPAPNQPYIALVGSSLVPKLDSMVCGRKGLLGIEPRALPFRRASRLLGSHQTLPGEFCWQAALFDSDDKPFCNGALIHRQWVLTTAHCVKRIAPSKTTVKLGIWAANSTASQQQNGVVFPPVQSFRVLEAFIHYNYDAVTLDNNMALLHLENVADFSEPEICLVCLPSQDSREGSQCTVTSFPTNNDAATTVPQDAVLSKLDLTIVNKTTCELALQATGKLQKSFQLNGDVTLCGAASPGEDTCRGDGGSGLVCEKSDGNFELAGLVSWGLSCGLGSPTVFTKVAVYNNWIQEIIRRYA